MLIHEMINLSYLTSTHILKKVLKNGQLKETIIQKRYAKGLALQHKEHDTQ